MKLPASTTLPVIAALTRTAHALNEPSSQFILNEPSSQLILNEPSSPVMPVKLASGTIVGRSHLGIDTFNGIPYADPPVGPLRLKPPQKLSRNLGTLDATGTAPTCPQMPIPDETRNAIQRVSSALLDFPFFQVPDPQQEDCLTVSVQRSSGTKPDAKLPVLVWIYGGAFQLGSTNGYDASSLLNEAAGDGLPFVYVAINYRVGGFGFMPGVEILRDGSANLGLLDQRMAIEWVAENIGHFGGDPDKVTLWGESAGSASVFDQMALYGGKTTYNSKPLFRGAIMDSGSVMPSDPVDCPQGQAIYDAVVQKAGCAGKSDTLSCLRALDYQTFYNAATSVPAWLSFYSGALSYLPRPDGVVLPLSPERLIASRRYHAVPMIIGDQEDEGTLLSLFQQSLKTDDDLVDYFSELYFHNATKEQIRELVDAYPSDFEGSPFGTGAANILYPNFKRISAILGDLTFTLTRRKFLELTSEANPKVPAWSYLSSYNRGQPYLGTYHASDIFQVFNGPVRTYATQSCRRYYFDFLYDMDPNKGKGGYANWPLWKEARELMWFKTQCGNGYLKDDFRSSAYEVINRLGDVLRL
ncbi:hypothetical protein G6O67_008267 [Ophiocordyceps sinensis]|uniref:Carboxylic ester hydrolase n=2 Tax=Ophiocordyceps sinensis TaxID=72228 RepID=A0A8H4LSM0_9HYPO|nr:lipase 3 precursor [Ophiocordyceps sinensis CO18]KAF4504870.1 hypothetical protein G6O67_008267 [Ophiocordyceps sinensis]